MGHNKKAKESSLRRGQTCLHLDLGLPASGNGKKSISAVQASQSEVLAPASLTATTTTLGKSCGLARGVPLYTDIGRLSPLPDRGLEEPEAHCEHILCP